MKFSIEFFEFLFFIKDKLYDYSIEYLPNDLSIIEFHILQHIYLLKDNEIKNLSNKFFISERRLRYILSKLIEKNYLQAVRDEKDRRKYIYHITADAKKILDEFFFQMTRDIKVDYKDYSSDVLSNSIECMKYLKKVL